MVIKKSDLRSAWDSPDDLYDDVEPDPTDYSIEGRIKRAGVHRIYRTSSLADFPDNDYTGYTNKPSHTSKGLLVYGSVGSGKTHLLCALLRARQERFPATNQILVTFSDLLYSLRNAQAADSYEERVEELKTVQVLYVDDFGVGKVTDWAHEVITMIINYRYNNELQLFVSSNVPVEVLREMMPRAASRIFQMCDIVGLGGEDRRLG